ncbi:MAG: flippase [bacterium]|nr:flippase [bacterium]
MKEAVSSTDRIIDELQGSLRTLLRGGGLSMGGVILRRIFAVVYVFVLTAYLGADGYGAYMLLFGAVTIMTVTATMGLGEGTMRFVAQFRAGGRTDQVRGMVRAATGLGLASSVVVALAGWTLADPIASRVFHQPALAGLLRWMSLAVPASVLGVLWLHGTKGFKRMEETVWISNLFEPAARIGLFLVLVLGGYGLGAAVGSHIVAVVASAALAGFALRRLTGPGRGPVEPGQTSALIKFSAPLLGVGMLGVIMGWTDTLMLGYFTGMAQVGVYNVALRVAALCGMVHFAFNSIFTPIIADQMQRGERESLGQLFKIDTRWVFTLTLPIFILVVLFSRDILAFFGSEFTQGGLALVVLSAATFFVSSTGSSGSMIHMAGWTRLSFVNMCIISGLNVLLNLLLIPRFGILGAAIGTGTSLIMGNALYLGQVWWYLKISPYDRKWVKPLVAGLAAGLVVAVMQRWALGASPAWNMAFSTGAFGLCYVGLLLVLQLEREDQLMIRLVRERIFRV